MTEVVIASAARTPVGAFLGGLSGVSASHLGSVAIRGALSRAGVAPADVDEVIMGQILTAGGGQNPARQAAVDAEHSGMRAQPIRSTSSAVPACAAVALGYQAIQLGHIQPSSSPAARRA